MADSRHHILKKGFSGSAGILLSRVAGLARDILMARMLGGGAVMSAWVFAFTVPNLFRRLFGEGEAAKAVVPVVSHSLREGGVEKARRDFGTITATLGLVLAAISVLGGAVGLIAGPWLHKEMFVLAMLLLPILMPYTFFICLTGMFSGVLNRFGHYFLPALTAVIMNLAMILALLLSRHCEPRTQVFYVCWATLLSGLAQLALTLWLLKKEKMTPFFFRPRWRKDPAVADFLTLVLPGIVGGGVYQINTLVDRFFAGYAGEYAAPALYYSERIIYLPVGIFAVSIGNACLSHMSQSAAEGEMDSLASTLRYGVRQIFYITIPVAVFMLIFREPMLKLIYFGRAFGERELQEAAIATFFYCLGIPFFGAIKIVVSAYYARKDSKTPLKVAVICVALNLALNCLLVQHLKQGGIALATSIAAVVNVGLLLWFFKRHFKIELGFGEIAASCARTSALAVTAVALAYAASLALVRWDALKLVDWRGAVSFSLIGAVFFLVFFGLGLLFKDKEMEEMLGPLGRRLLRKIKS